jgi:hypothetical protein
MGKGTLSSVENLFSYLYILPFFITILGSLCFIVVREIWQVGLGKSSQEAAAVLATIQALNILNNSFQNL